MNAVIPVEVEQVETLSHQCILMYPVSLFAVYKRVSVDLMKQLLAAPFGNPCSECLANEVCNRAHERHEESDRGSVSGEA